MGNLIKNAGLLDGTTNFAAVGAASLDIDEANVGAPGRAALIAGGTGSGEQGLKSELRPVTAGLDYDCHGHWVGTGATALAVEWLNVSDAVVATSVLPVTRVGVGAAERGLPTTFNRSYARLTAPATATQARLKLTVTFVGSTAFIMALLKPYIGRPGAGGSAAPFDPGPSDNPDLAAVAAWPSDLPPILWDGYGAPPTSNRRSFAADSGIPQSNLTGAVERFQMKGQIRCSPVEVERLRRFHRESPPPFWFVKPDTDELCLAEWLEDGAPTLQQLAPGGGGYYGVGLLLAVA